MRPILVKCWCCNGCGKVALTGVYAETYDIIRVRSGEFTAADLARENGVKATALNNRLARLEQLGLVISRRYGRKRLFRSVGG